MSDKRRAVNAERKEILERHFGPRENWRCCFHRYLRGLRVGDEILRCYGPVNGHELLKRSRGGSILDVTNITLLCQFHNGWVEDNPKEAEALGLAKHSWE